MTWLDAVLILVVCGLVCGAAAGLALREARRRGEVEQFRAACSDLERAIGGALAPPLERLLMRLGLLNASSVPLSAFSSHRVALVYRVPPWLVSPDIDRPGWLGRVGWRLRCAAMTVGLRRVAVWRLP